MICSEFLLLAVKLLSPDHCVQEQLFSFLSWKWSKRKLINFLLENRHYVTITSKYYNLFSPYLLWRSIKYSSLQSGIFLPSMTLLLTTLWKWPYLKRIFSFEYPWLLYLPINLYCNWNWTRFLKTIKSAQLNCQITNKFFMMIFFRKNLIDNHFWIQTLPDGFYGYWKLRCDRKWQNPNKLRVFKLWWTKKRV